MRERAGVLAHVQKGNELRENRQAGDSYTDSPASDLLSVAAVLHPRRPPHAASWKYVKEWVSLHS